MQSDLLKRTEYNWKTENRIQIYMVVGNIIRERQGCMTTGNEVIREISVICVYLRYSGTAIRVTGDFVY